MENRGHRMKHLHHSRPLQHLTRLLLPLLLVSTAAVSHAGDSVPHYVQVNGTAEIAAQPDYLRLHLTMTDTRDSLAKTRDSINKGMNQLLQICKDMGIADQDIDASRISNYPQYEWTDKGRQYRGERIDRPVTITLRDMSHYGDLVHQLLQNERVQLNNTELAFNNPEALQNQALKLALESARNKARLMASTLDAQLGKVMFINESGSSAPQPMYEMRAMASRMEKVADPAPMMVQEQTVSASVEVRFELE
jgi:uncharacterized protein